ncbi:MAG TPA: type II secretion system F family protein [Firmicutes bacterium]|nr:type II secretion system F family protein [Candidatus Fermentithermobacillaceae bacterium]
MALFKYRAVAPDGTRISGLKQAPDLKSFLTTMRSGGYAVLDVREVKSRPRSKDPKKVTLSAIEKSQVFHEISTMLSSGVPLKDCLTSIAGETSSSMSVVLTYIVDNLEAGISMSQSMMTLPKAFSPVEAYIASSGEQTGAMEQSFEEISAYLKREAQAQAQLKTAMAYPLMVLVVTGLVIGIILGVVVPAFSSLVTLEESSLPLAARILVSLPTALKAGWWLLVLALLALAAVFRRVTSSDEGRKKLELILRRMPVAGDPVWSGALAKFCRTLGLLLEAGIPINQSFMVAGNTTGLASFKLAAAFLERSVESGSTISAAMQDSGVFPPLLYHMVFSGEKSGKLPAMLAEAARYYDSRYEEGLKSLSQKIEPLITLFLAAIIGLVALALLSIIQAVTSAPL